MPEFVIFLHPLATDARSPEVIRTHCLHLDRLVEDARLIAAGPFADGSGGMIVATFASEQDALEFARSDPFVVHGFSRPEVRRWEWSRPENGHLGMMQPRAGSVPGFLDTLRRRATVRRFRDEPMPEDVSRTLIEAAITAPSEFNLQPWRPILCTTPADREALRACCFDQSHIEDAPLTVICAVDTDVFQTDAPRAVDEFIAAGRVPPIEREAQIEFVRACYSDPRAVRDSAIRNGTIFGHHLLIAALSMGYAGFWLGGFDEPNLRAAFGLPDRFIIPGVIGIGRPDGDTGPMPRRPLSEIVHVPE